MWQFLTTVFVAFINRFSERAFFGLIIIGSFVLVMGTLAYIPLPGESPGEKNAELFGQGFVALIGAIGIIVGAIWKVSSTERTDRDTINKLVDKSPPATGEALEAIKELKDDRSHDAPTEGATCPVCGAYRPGTGNVDAAAAGTYTAPDNIPGVEP